MLRYIKILGIALAVVVALGQPLEAAQRFIGRPRPFIVRPYYVQPYYGFGYWYGPGWYYPWQGPAYVIPRSQTGEVKIVTQFKDAQVYVDGGYAGVAGKLKHFDLAPGNHDIELRDSSGRAILQERVQVILGKTTEIRVNP
jgi:hypothetical protein